MFCPNKQRSSEPFVFELDLVVTTLLHLGGVGVDGCVRALCCVVLCCVWCGVVWCGVVWCGVVWCVVLCCVVCVF